MSKKKAEREVSAGGIVFRRDPDGTPRFLLIRDSYRHWGFPKGHLEDDETPAVAAERETREETGLEHLTVQSSIDTIDWYFRFRGRLIHKVCHFFLMMTDFSDTSPQRSEGITACRWESYEDAAQLVSYANARDVLRRAHEIVTSGSTAS